MQTKAKDILQNYLKKWKRVRILEIVLLAFAIAIFLVALIWFFVGREKMNFQNVAILILFVGTMLSFLIYQFSSASKIGIAQLVNLLNNKYTALEQSVDLLLIPKEELNSLGRLQQEKIAQRLVQMQNLVSLPNQLPKMLIWLAGSLLLSSSLMAFQQRKENLTPINNIQITKQETLDSLQTKTEIPVTVLTSASVAISPPAYTKLPILHPKDLNLNIPIYSNVKWNFQFSTPIEKGNLVLNGKQKIPLAKINNNNYTVQVQIQKNGFYYIEYQGASQNEKTSDYYKINIIEDKPPIIELEGLATFNSYRFDEVEKVSFETQLTDDYGINAAQIVATLTRGKGEGVKFREDTLSLGIQFTQQKDYKIPFTLDLKKMEMEPGDELYFHVEAQDNRNPNPQTTKTFKYIIALEDTTQTESTAFGGLAVDRMPEYFRSQRQIIIDTEKLIALKAQLDPKIFQAKSNNIAIDQKLLRLRYGKFLGEEFASAIGGNVEHEEEDHHEENHEQEGEHQEGETISEDIELGHDHEDEAIDPFSNQNDVDTLLEGVAHFHDLVDHATLYDASTSAKLRIALSEMWDAELHLRMGRPKKALPYEYKALKLIKEIQQASRIYVERVGFDPPVIKVAQTRLSGELEDIQNVQRQYQNKKKKTYKSITSALPVIEKLLEQKTNPTLAQKDILNQAAKELAAVAIEKPGPYLSALQQLKILTEKNITIELLLEYCQNIRFAFWQLIPQQTIPAIEQRQRKSRLSEKYLEAIN